MAGAATVGKLIIDLSANVAQLRTDMQSAAGVVEQVGGQISKAADFAKNALLGMAAALGPAAFVDMIGSTIEATAALNNMATRTGASVEALSAIRSIAKVVGVDMEAVAAGIVKFDKAMYEAAASGGKVAEVFQILGVQFQNSDGRLRDVNATLLDFAVAMSKMEDGATKTAFAQTLLGKAGAGLIEVLNELGIAGEYQVRVTSEQAAIAEDFERNLVRLGASGRELRQILANEMTPALDTLAKVWLEFQNQAGGLRDIVKGMAADGTLKNWAMEVAFYFAGIADIVVTVKSLFVAFGETLAQIALVVTAAGTVFKGLAEVMLGGFRDGIKTMAQGLLQVQTAWEAFKESWGNVVESTAFRDSFVRNAEAVNNTTTALRNHAPVVEDTEKKTKAAAKATDEWNAYFKLLWDNVMAEERALKAYNAEIAKTIEHANRYTESLRGIVQQTEFEVSQLGLSAEQIRINTEVRNIEIRTLQELAKIKDKGLEQQEKEIRQAAEEAKAAVAASIEKQKAYNDWLGLLQTTTSGVKNLILDFVEHGSSAFKNLWQNFKNWALEALAEIAAKQIVVSIVGALGLGGSAGAAAASNVAGGPAGGSIGSLIGSLLGGGNNGIGLAGSIGNALFGGTINSAAAGGIASIFGPSAYTAALAGDAFLPAALGIAGEGAVGLGSMAGSLGILGPIGLAAGAGLLAYSLLGNKGGGPMTREYGLAGGNLSSFGDLSSLHKLIGTDAASSAGYSSLAQSLVESFNAYLKQLGGTAGQAAFGIYTSQDPKGTALSTVDVRASLGGSSVYVGNSGETIARNEEALKAEVERQAQAAILGALKAANLPTIVKEFLGLVNIGDATLEAIVGTAAALTKMPEELQARFMEAVRLDPGVLAAMGEFATAYGRLQEVLNIDPEAAVVKATATAQQTHFEKLLQLRGGLEALVGTYDGSSSATNQLADATREYVNAQIAALSEIAQLKTSLGDLFGNSIEQIGMALMDAQSRSNYLIEEARKTMGLLRETTDPANIDKFAKLINKDLVDAFNILSPEQQRANQAMFLNLLQEANSVTVEQLEASKDAVLQSGEGQASIMDTIRVNLNQAADKQFTAATKLEQAADAMLTAAATNNKAASDMGWAANNMGWAANNFPTTITVDVRAEQP